MTGKPIVMGDYEIYTINNEVEIFHIHTRKDWLASPNKQALFVIGSLQKLATEEGVQGQDDKSKYYVLCEKNDKTHYCRLCEEKVPSAIEFKAHLSRGRLNG